MGRDNENGRVASVQIISKRPQLAACRLGRSLMAPLCRVWPIAHKRHLVVGRPLVGLRLVACGAGRVSLRPFDSIAPLRLAGPLLRWTLLGKLAGRSPPRSHLRPNRWARMRAAPSRSVAYGAPARRCGRQPAGVSSGPSWVASPRPSSLASLDSLERRRAQRGAVGELRAQLARRRPKGLRAARV